LLAALFTLSLPGQELGQPNLCLGHIKTLAVTVDNEASHCHDVLVPFGDMLFDVGQ